MARMTVKSLAAALGVSPATVSNAYNHPDQLSAQLRERIFAKRPSSAIQDPMLPAGHSGLAGPRPSAYCSPSGCRTRSAIPSPLSS